MTSEQIAAAEAARDAVTAPLWSAYRAASDAARYAYSEAEMVAYRAYLAMLPAAWDAYHAVMAAYRAKAVL